MVKISKAAGLVQRFVTSGVTGLNNVLIWMAMGMPTFICLGR